jgi:hypothetical protein
MTRDIESLQGGSDAKFNAHIAILERISDRQGEADKASCVPTGEAQYVYYKLVKRIETIMWPYLTTEEKDGVNKLRPPINSIFGMDPMNGKRKDNYSEYVADKINAWEVELNTCIAKRGLALKAGKDPSHAMIE